MLAKRSRHALRVQLLITISMIGGTAFASGAMDPSDPSSKTSSKTGTVSGSTIETSDPSAANANAGAAAAESIIQSLDDVLLDIMKRADQLGLKGRLETIEPLVSECFDLPFMARLTLGRAWNDLSDEAQRRWVDTFSSYTIYKLADRFNGFSGQWFEIVGQKPASKDTLIIQTLLKRPSDDDVRLDYRMRETESSWKIIDIYAKGRISEIALRRSEYTAILKRGGIELLIESVSGMMDFGEEQAKD
jgi:phospholipid transport system substrate-binding protein